MYAETWMSLPGNLEHWPQDVRVNGAPAPVVARDGVPSLRLAPGSYTVAGRFSWSTRPESLPLPPLTALVDLTVDNQRVAQPERPDGALWLGKRRSAEQAAAMEVQVYRLVRGRDARPIYSRSIRLNVAGDAREELLGRVLPDGFTPLSLDRRRARAPGTRRHAARAGARRLARDHARGARAASPTRWRARSRRRQVAARGDLELRGQRRLARGGRRRRRRASTPSQANVPREWQRFPGVSHGRGFEAHRGRTQPRH